jgi:hypothetical protein
MGGNLVHVAALEAVRLDCIVAQTQPRTVCRDPWLELYFPFIEGLHAQSGAGPISAHYLSVATRAYGSYCETCDGFYRRSAWGAIAASLQWLAQLGGNRQ